MQKRTDCQMQPDLDKLAVWFNYNRLTFNTSKCEITNFGLGRQKEVNWYNQKLPQKMSYKYLGIHVDSKLTFRAHIDYLVKNSNKILWIDLQNQASMSYQMFDSFL